MMLDTPMRPDEPSEIEVARKRAQIADVIGVGLDVLGRQLLVGRHGRDDKLYRDAIARTMAMLGDNPTRTMRRTRPRATHRLEVFMREGVWMPVHKGSEAECQNERAKLGQSWPSMELPQMRIEVVLRKVRKKKPWSVRDDDHVADGTRVMLRATAEEIHPGMAVVRSSFGLEPTTARTGMVTWRNHRVADNYLVLLDGSTLSIGVKRMDFTIIEDGIVDINSRRRA